jgi:TolC family type I secretion outer membrane protein
MRKYITFLVIWTLAVTASAEDKVWTLNECIETALQNNPSFLKAQGTLEDFRLQKSVARAGLLPQVTFGADYTHQEYQTERTQFQLQSPFFVNREYSAGLNLQQTLWDGGNSLANFNKAQSEFQASNYDFEDIKQTLIYTVEEAYLNLLKQNQLLTVYEETLKSSIEALKKAQSMETLGAVAHSDVLKAKVKVEEDRMLLITTQKNLALAKANLNFLIGADLRQEITVADIGAIEDRSLPYDDAVNFSLENHPALKKAGYDKKSAQYTITMARSSYLPQIEGFYRYGYSSVAFSEMLQPFDNQFSWSTGISINLNLFDGLSTQANLQRAKIGEKYAEDNLEEVRRQVLLETQTAYLGLEEAKNNIEVAKQRVLAAEEDLKLSTARYELGSGTILEQIDAQVALTSARAGKIQAEYDYRFAQSRLQKAMGRLK